MPIEITINKKSLTLTNIYRSSNNNNNSLTNLVDKVDTLLTQLSTKNANNDVFLDSNINLLKLAHTHTAQLYHNTILNNGFLNLLHKATRIQGINFLLIDQILTNNNHSLWHLNWGNSKHI